MEWKWVLWGLLALFVVWALRITLPSLVRYWKLKRM